MMTDCVDLMEERKCWRRREDEGALFVFRGISVMMIKMMMVFQQKANRHKKKHTTGGSGGSD